MTDIVDEAKWLLIHTEYKQYYENGQLELHCWYRDGNFDGEFKKWHDNGQLWVHTWVQDGKKDGEFKEWLKDGQLFVHCWYKDDEKDGLLKAWRDGELKMHRLYENGKEIKDYI